jgi:hypothetical protein
LENLFLWCGYGLAMFYMLLLGWWLRRRVRTGALLSRREYFLVLAVMVAALGSFFAWTLV